MAEHADPPAPAQIKPLGTKHIKTRGDLGHAASSA
jgi:hypothetical protein